jgi:hypothetical protein
MCLFAFSVNSLAITSSRCLCVPLSYHFISALIRLSVIIESSIFSFMLQPKIMKSFIPALLAERIARLYSGMEAISFVHHFDISSFSRLSEKSIMAFIDDLLTLARFLFWPFQYLLQSLFLSMANLLLFQSQLSSGEVVRAMHLRIPHRLYPFSQNLQVYS